MEGGATAEEQLVTGESVPAPVDLQRNNRSETAAYSNSPSASAKELPSAPTNFGKAVLEGGADISCVSSSGPSATLDESGGATPKITGANSSAAGLRRKRRKQHASLSVYLMNRRLNSKARTFSSSSKHPEGLKLLSRFRKLDAGFFCRYMAYFAGDFKPKNDESSLTLEEMRLAVSAHFASLHVEPLDLLAAFMKTVTSTSPGAGDGVEYESPELFGLPPPRVPSPAHYVPSSQELQGAQAAT